LFTHSRTGDYKTQNNLGYSANFIGAEALLGIFAYVSKQRAIIHMVEVAKRSSGSTYTTENDVLLLGHIK